jgi:hypothetical protein
MIHHVTGLKIVKSWLCRGCLQKKELLVALPGLRQIILR